MNVTPFMSMNNKIFEIKLFLALQFKLRMCQHDFSSTSIKLVLLIKRTVVRIPKKSLNVLSNCVIFSYNYN